MKLIRALLFLAVILLPINAAFAYVASSPNYQMDFDTLDGGGGYSTSTGYKMQDSLGQNDSGSSSGTAYQIMAGYQQMEPATISVSVASTLLLADLNGFTGDVKDNTIGVTVTTSNATGYSLKVKSSTDPAMKSATSSFPNYASDSLVPLYNWSVASDSSAFGFNPQGAHVASGFQHDESNTCSTGSTITMGQCWYYFGTSDKEISNYSGAVTDDLTTVRMRYESGATRMQPSGTYSADITMTATMN